MLIFPAIDLRQGRCVRLRQGDPRAETVFGDDPAAVAVRWAALGAAWLHVVNLDGALGDQDHRAPNLRRLQEIRHAVSVPIQFGGGLRTLGDVERALALGATRVVLGTAAVRRPAFAGEAVKRFGSERIVAGLDARDGRVATHGWQEISDRESEELALQLKGHGIERLVYTDIGRDGMLSGVNVAATVALARATGLKVIASGGVRDLDDLRRLHGHEADGIEGVIVGQALYTGDVDLRAALAAVAARAPS